ncbi:MAG: hypothetical protein LBG60_16375 [Bifidobacteriaceae bacterium]|jgi:hypothetical protein|nr:hypothetical protein [Bifidobacteriaceae bacterium]
MTALIITESYFGNTAAIADAIAQALGGPGAMAVESLPVADAPVLVPPGTDLLILAAPTHDYSLPRPATRARARQRGARHGGQEGDGPGLRDWIATAEPVPGVKVVTVDTAVKTGFMLSSAAKTAARLMGAAGFENVRRGATFFVSDLSGPLEPEELLRARAWATTLAAGLKSLTKVRAA